MQIVKKVTLISALGLLLSGFANASDSLEIINSPYIDKTPQSVSAISKNWLKKINVYINVNTAKQTRLPLETLLGELEVAGLNVISNTNLSNVYYSGANIAAGETALSVMNKIASNTGLRYQVQFTNDNEGVVVIDNNDMPMNDSTLQNVASKPIAIIRSGECSFSEPNVEFLKQDGQYYFQLKKGTLSDNINVLIKNALPGYRLVNKVGHHLVFNNICLFADSRDELIQKIVEPYSTPSRLYFATFPNKVAAVFYEDDKSFAKYFRGRN